MGLEIGLNILEKSWKSFGKSLEKMCGNPEKGNVSSANDDAMPNASRGGLALQNCRITSFFFSAVVCFLLSVATFKREISPDVTRSDHPT